MQKNRVCVLLKTDLLILHGFHTYKLFSYSVIHCIQKCKHKSNIKTVKRIYEDAFKSAMQENMRLSGLSKIQGNRLF